MYSRMRHTDQSSYSDDQVQVRHVTSGARRAVHSDHSTPVTRLKSRSRTSSTPIHQQVEKERTHRGVRKPVAPHISLNEVKPKVTALIYFLQALQTIFSKFIFITIIYLLSPLFINRNITRSLTLCALSSCLLMLLRLFTHRTISVCRFCCWVGYCLL